MNWLNYQHKNSAAAATPVKYGPLSDAAVFFRAESNFDYTICCRTLQYLL